MPESLEEFEARCKAATTYKELHDILEAELIDESAYRATESLQNFEACLRNAQTFNDFYKILQRDLDDESEMIATMEKLRACPKTEQRDAVWDHARLLIREKKSRELLAIVNAFLRDVAAQQQAALQAAAQSSTPPRKREFRIDDVPPKPT